VLTPEEREHWKAEAGLRQLGELLYWRWDPIDVTGDFPYSQGEYADYARELCSMLLDAASRDDIAAFLARVERESMEQRPDKRAAAQVAELVEAWFEKSVAQWRELGA
jgi:hypothetical protein